MTAFLLPFAAWGFRGGNYCQVGRAFVVPLNRFKQSRDLSHTTGNANVMCLLASMLRRSSVCLLRKNTHDKCHVWLVRRVHLSHALGWVLPPAKILLFDLEASCCTNTISKVEEGRST
jgi:hypothetical protein